MSRIRFSRFVLLAVCVCVTLAGTASASHAKKRATKPRSEHGMIPMLQPDEQALWQRLCFRAEDSFDSTRGGFVDKRGILNESAIDLGFLLGTRERHERWAGFSLYTVQWMLGLEDSIGGGFYMRHEVSAGQGQFERPTILNARRLENLIDAWERTNDARYWVSAVRLLEFAERNVVDGRGGFTSDPVGDQDLVPEVNGVAIRSWLRWWAAARDPKRRDFALRSIDRLSRESWKDSLGFVRTNSFGELLAWPQLSDQTEMGRALVMSAQLAGRRDDLERAERVAEIMLENFADERGTFRSETPLKTGRFSRKSKPIASENARAALFLCELAHVAREPRYLDVARRVWRAYAKELEKTKLGSADWALAMDAAISPVFPKRPPENAKPVEKGKPQRTNKSRLSETKVGVRDTR